MTRHRSPPGPTASCARSTRPWWARSPPSRPATSRLVRTPRASRPGVVLVLGLVLGLVVGACGDKPVATIGQPAPPIAATTLEGKPIDLAKYRGKPLVVNFWASWCVPCRNEFPMFKDKLATLGPTDGLQVVGVLYKDQPDLAKAFLADFGADWPSLDDADGTIAAAYRVVAPPQTYFIDKDGVLRGIQIGEVRPEDFDTQYAKIAP